MEEEIQNTQAEAATKATEPTVQTIGEVIQQEAKKPETVGLDKFLEIKKENKELKNQLNDLAKRIESGDNKQDVAEDIEALANEHDIDPNFLNKLVKSIESKAEKNLEERISQKLAPLTEKDKEEKIEKAFSKAYEATISEMPEYENLVNREVIKVLSLDPKNANKTFAQLIEETYGKAITGKRTIETTKPGGGKEPTEIDFDKALKDTEYFKEIMSNPTLKKKYNDSISSRVSKYL